MFAGYSDGKEGIKNSKVDGISDEVYEQLLGYP